jgi:hypothetical protein
LRRHCLTNIRVQEQCLEWVVIMSTTAGHVEFIGLVHIQVIWKFIGGFHLPIQ